LQTSQHHYHCSTTPGQGSNENGTTKDYLAQFQYNQDTDTYTCPGETLKPGSWHKKPPIETAIILKIPNPKCKACPVKHLCTVEHQAENRPKYADAVEENNKRYHENPQLYRRQEINEHIFGTIKRQWGYNHTNLTGLEK
jgi:hypothetical protein